MKTAYNYKELRTPTAIRVLHLEPVKARDDPLSGRFSVTDLSKPVRYNALSYTWDGEIPSVPLLVDGQTVLITPNCASALRRLRKPSKARTFWIDAVCINQADTQERNAQVSMMGEIYKKASWVFVWLGERTEISQEGWRRLDLKMKLRDCLRPVSEVLSLLYLLPLIPGTIVVSARMLAHDLYFTGSNIYSIKNGLCQCSYWTRVWTVQEFTAQKNCRIYVGDTRGIPASIFMKEIASLSLKNTSLHGQLFSFYRKQWREDNVRPSAFLENLGSSEPRDYVFALKTVLPNTLRLVEVNYEARIGQVFAEATKSVTLHKQSLGLLEYAAIKSDIPGLPSWAVDWSSQRRPIDNPKPHYYDRGWKRDISCVEFSPDSLTMKVKGTRLFEFPDCFSDVFPHKKSLGSAFPQPPVEQESLETSYGTIFRNFLRRIYQEEEHNKAADVGKSFFSKILHLVASNNQSIFSSSKARTKLAENWFRILVTGATSRDLDLHDAAVIREELEQPVNWRISDSFVKENADLQKFLQACEQKRLFMAEGTIGLCWPDVRAHDQLIRVRDRGGSENLIVIRPQGTHFVLAGHAALAQEKLDQWIESDLQWFEIV